jgi:NADH-quinone oxidoreductase subunit N
MIFGTSISELLPFAPFISLSGAIVVLIGAHFARWSYTIILGLVAILLTAAWVSTFMLPSIGGNIWGITFDAIGMTGLQIILPVLLAIAVMGISVETYDRKVATLMLVLLSGVGAIATLIAHNWMVLFVAVQCLSIPIYALIAGSGQESGALSASLKYLLLSAIAMAFMLFGIMLLYSAFGTMDFYEQAKVWPQVWERSGVLVSLGLAHVLVGFGFKLSLAPFHAWAPDVYEHAPLPVLGLLILVTKSVIILAFLRAGLVLNEIMSGNWSLILPAIILLSLWVGNGLMLWEKHFLRLLAFLSIGHLGFLLVAVMAHNRHGVDAIYLDLAAFAVAILVVLSTLQALKGRRLVKFSIDEFRGLHEEYPWHAAVLTLALISLAGIPLTAGFVGKYAIFMAGIAAGQWFLVANMAAVSVLGICALVRVVMVFYQPLFEKSATKRQPISSLLVLGAVALIVFGLMPDFWLSWVQDQTAGIMVGH